MASSLEAPTALRRLTDAKVIASAEKLLKSGLVSVDGSSLYFWHIIPSMAEEQKLHGLEYGEEHVSKLAGFMWQNFDTEQKNFWASQTGKLRKGNCEPLDSKVLGDFFAGATSGDAEMADETGATTSDHEMADESMSDEATVPGGSENKTSLYDIMDVHKGLRKAVTQLHKYGSIAGEKALNPEEKHQYLIQISRLLSDPFILFAYHSISFLRKETVDKDDCEKLLSKVAQAWEKVSENKREVWRRRIKALKESLHEKEELALQQLDKYTKPRNHFWPRKDAEAAMKEMLGEKKRKKKKKSKAKGSAQRASKKSKDKRIKKGSEGMEEGQATPANAGKDGRRAKKLARRVQKASAMPKNVA